MNSDVLIDYWRHEGRFLKGAQGAGDSDTAEFAAACFVTVDRLELLREATPFVRMVAGLRTTRRDGSEMPDDSAAAAPPLAGVAIAARDVRAARALIARIEGDDA